MAARHLVLHFPLRLPCCITKVGAQKSEVKRCSQSLEPQRPFVKWEEPCKYDVTASRCDGSPAAIDVMGAISSGSRSTRLKAAGAQVLLPLLLQLHDPDLQRSISHSDSINLDTTTRRLRSASEHLDRCRARARASMLLPSSPAASSPYLTERWDVGCLILAAAKLPYHTSWLLNF